MKKALCVTVMGLFIVSLYLSLYTSGSPRESWMGTARITGGILWTDMTDEEMRETVDKISERGQSVILTWVPNPLLEDWSSSLEFLGKASRYIHGKYPDMALIIYQGPLEIVTPHVDTNRDGRIDPGEHSIYTDHPEWLQVGLDGRKAVFYGDIAFWIGSTDEDVWLCPNDPEYRELTKSFFVQLAETGIDGVWVDIPRFLCDFGDWDSNWACHCDDCQKKFKEDTGLDIPEKVDWNDRVWKTWVLWRQKVITNYIKELSNVVKSVNPDCALIVEHWHGIDAESVRGAWSPILLREVTDSLAHEYPAASYDPSTYDYYNYLRDVASYIFYRGLDKEHPSWILAYSSEKEGQKMLAASVLTAGCNFYDTDVPNMAGTVSVNQQAEIFSWIKEYTLYYYEPEPWGNVGVYYSKATMDFLYHEQWGEGDFYCEFMGLSMLLLSSHIPYRVIFSLDDLDRFHTVILPNTACMSDEDIENVNQFAERGGKVLATGETGAYDEWGDSRSRHLLDSEVIRIPDLLGAHYYREVQPYGSWWIPEERGDGAVFKVQFQEIVEDLEIPLICEIDASEEVIVLPFTMGNTVVFRILNLSQISKSEPEPQTVTLKVLWSVRNGSLYQFLSSSERIEENPVTFGVDEHALLVYDIDEPITVMSNSFDKPAADLLSDILEKNGFFVERSTSCRACMEQLRGRAQVVILGGHEAQDTGELVEILLTDEEKRELEQKGAQYIFVKIGFFAEGQTIVIIAGHEREDTYALIGKETDEILRHLSRLETACRGIHCFVRA